MTEQMFSDQALQEAARLVRDAMLSALPEPEECEHEFSDGFYAKMEKLIRKHRRRQSTHKWMMRVAAVFIAAIVGITSWLTVDVRARETLFEWVRTVYENFVEYRYTGEQTQAELPEYELTWLPDGFEKVDGIKNDIQKTEFYYNSETGDIIVFEYMKPHDGVWEKFLDSINNLQCEKVKVWKTEGDFYLGSEEKASNLVWKWEEYLFVVDSTLEKLVILDIAENIELVKPTK